jgi:hypothetical protein
MSSYEKCSVCHEYGFVASHKCKPSWEVFRFEYGDEDDPAQAFGRDAEEAAISYSERHFADWEHPLDFEVWVRKSADDPWQKFDISVEAVPSFSASLKTKVAVNEVSILDLQ